MAASAPAGATGEIVRVIKPTDQNCAGGHLLLEVALQAKELVALGQEFLIHGPVWGMTALASLAHGFVLENKWAALRRVTLETRFIFGGKRGASALDRAALVRVVAIRATYLAVLERVMMRLREGGALIQMALVTRLRRTAGIDYGMRRATGFYVDTAGAVAGFASHIQRIIAMRH